MLGGCLNITPRIYSRLLHSVFHHCHPKKSAISGYFWYPKSWDEAWISHGSLLKTLWFNHLQSLLWVCPMDYLLVYHHLTCYLDCHLEVYRYITQFQTHLDLDINLLMYHISIITKNYTPIYLCKPTCWLQIDYKFLKSPPYESVSWGRKRISSTLPARPKHLWSVDSWREIALKNDQVFHTRTQMGHRISLTVL